MHRIVLDVDDSIYVQFNSFLQLLPVQSLRIVGDSVTENNNNTLNDLVHSIREKGIFSSVEDGLSWQNEQRDEW